MYSRDIYVERACSVECKEDSVLKMANIKNLFCFFLTLITCRAQTQSWENTKSRLQITLIHLDSKALNARSVHEQVQLLSQSIQFDMKIANSAAVVAMEKQH